MPSKQSYNHDIITNRLNNLDEEIDTILAKLDDLDGNISSLKSYAEWVNSTKGSGAAAGGGGMSDHDNSYHDVIQGNVTATRAVDTVYQNTGSGDMFVVISATHSKAGAAESAELLSDAANPPTTPIDMEKSGNSQTAVNICGVVKQNHYYKLYKNGVGVLTLRTWFEYT